VDIKQILIFQIINEILRSGLRFTVRENNKLLRFMWHNTEYLGGAHGVAGILYVLLQVNKLFIKNLLETFVMTIQYFLIFRLENIYQRIK
jgi:hypothetical protein